MRSRTWRRSLYSWWCRPGWRGGGWARPRRWEYRMCGKSVDGGPEPEKPRGGAARQGRASGGGADPGRHGRDGRAQFRPPPARGAAEPERGARAARVVARERSAAARVGADLRGGDGGRGRGGAAGAGGGLADGRLAADPRAGDDRREP